MRCRYAGIQGFNEPPEDDIHQVTHKLMYELESKIASKPWVINFMHRDDIEFQDSIHSTSAAAEVIANTYSTQIIENIQEGIIRLSRMPTDTSF